jgi:CRISPR-associated endonuclease/helicase Cas3
MTPQNFDSTFEALTGTKPFPWQQKLYHRFANDEVPTSCNIPTGLGKTSVVAIWLIALANHPDKVPRRLVYVVNRRTVVDQTTDEVEKYRRNLQAAGLDNGLRCMCAIDLDPGDYPLAVSTLRGQFADNREWSADPCRPAVIVGTVDMIGSRLLFSGYGLGFRTRPLQAGFLGQDALLVHDEAHLEPAFQKLIEEIRDEQHNRERTGNLPWRKLHVMALTATGRQQATSSNQILDLTDEEKQRPPKIPDPPTEPLHVVWKRINARKALHLVRVEDEKKLLPDTISTIASDEKFKSSQRAILIFVRSVENVEKIVEKLQKAGLQVQQLTGTMRGLERDALPKDRIFARFLPSGNRPSDVTPAEGTVYLVCTSAGEVGVNISADHLICDLTTFESMAQRFGRVNRFGDCPDTQIHVVHPNQFDDEDPYEQSRKKTLELLQQLNGDASPAALDKLDPQARQEAFSPLPTILPVTDILLDAWSLTTVRESLPGRPPVEPYLHGIAAWQPPETSVAWREEVGILTGDLLEQYNPEDLLEDYPLKPHELLRDVSSRVLDRLKKRNAPAETPVWILADHGTVTVSTLGQLIENGSEAIQYRTLLLPPSAGALLNGMLASDSETANDVADQWLDDQGNPRRLRVWDDDPEFDQKIKGLRIVRVLDTRPDFDEEAGEEEQPTRRYWYWCVRPRAADDDASRTALQFVPWDDHTRQVKDYVLKIADKLKLPDDLKKALELAACFHDLGKKRQLWQRSIGNPDPEKCYAKGRKPRESNEKYRHEFGSLGDLESETDFQQLGDDIKDLVRHLIAAHHGRGRPHFPEEEIFDPEPKQKDVASIAAEVPRRFARLQRKYGRWGLAYLESLLRAADYAASAT